MDELEKLFAEASASVKKATTARPEPAAPAEPEAVPEAAAPPAAEEPARPAPSPSGAPVKVTGGSRTDSGLLLTGPGGSHPVDWSAITALALGRTDRGQALAFTAGGTRFYFEDGDITYKGLVAPLEPTAPANWRGLIGELAERSGSAEDAGIQAITQGGGVIPKHASLDSFLGAG